jgi:hypothetical protein
MMARCTHGTDLAAALQRARNRLQERGAAFDGDRPGRSHHGVELKKFERRRAELMG